MQYILYKEPIQTETLHIVQYLHSQEHITLLPIAIIERNHPPEIKELPTIETPRGLYVGIDRVVQWYEEETVVSNLLQKSKEWKKQNPKSEIYN